MTRLRQLKTLAMRKSPDKISQLGYSSTSPFRMRGANVIGSDHITMKNTTKPLVAVGGGSAEVMKPDLKKLQKGGSPTGSPTANAAVAGTAVMEIPFETLLALEPMLLESHLSTLSTKDKSIFMEKYTPLPDNMRRAALVQMIGKYPEIAQLAVSASDVPPKMEFQTGGLTGGPIGNPIGGPIGPSFNTQPSLRGSYNQVAESMYVQPRPLQTPNYNAMFLDFATPASTEATELGRQGRYAESDLLRQQILEANSYRSQMEKETMPRLYKNGGYASSLKKQNGGSTDKWEYVAPPTEGYEFSSITSNRPNLSNTALRPSTASGNTASSKQKTVRRPSTQPPPMAAPMATPMVAPVQPRQALTNTVAQFYQPTFSTPTYTPTAPTASNTTMALAAVTGDPIYSLTTTSMTAGRARSIGQTPTPWYALEGRPEIATPRSSTVYAGMKEWGTPSSVKTLNNPYTPAKGDSDKFVLISQDRSGKFENVFDPASRRKFRRDTQTGKYYEGFSDNPDRTVKEAMEIYRITGRPLPFNIPD